MAGDMAMAGACEIMMTELWETAIARDVSDIHILPNEATYLRINGELLRYPAVTAREWLHWWQKDLSSYHKSELEKVGSTEWTVFSTPAYRVSIFRVGGEYQGNIRILHSPSTLPRDEDEAIFQEISQMQTGLVVIGGATGSGKTTTLWRIVEEMNRLRDAHILLLEDPPELWIQAKRCCIRQRIVGSDVPDYATGLKAALREDPDVIVVGELRDEMSLATAFLAAETGHLVLATVHGGSIVDVIGRMIHAFPIAKQDVVRYQLASILCFIAVQHWHGKGKHRVLKRDFVFWNQALAHLVRERKERQIPSYVKSMSDRARISLPSLS